MRGWVANTLVVVWFAGSAGGMFIQANGGADRSANTAAAVLKDVRGDVVGEAQLEETPHGVLLKVEFREVPPGTRAFHIHERGRCEPPTFESAGEHWAPRNRSHGVAHPEGPHDGDLPNLHIPAEGRLTVELFVREATLGPGPMSLLDEDGTALVVHAGPDDHRTDPAGDAGDRIACGVIGG
jgi:superoxide dismutase, Cu-Zn family